MYLYQVNVIFDMFCLSLIFVPPYRILAFTIKSLPNYYERPSKQTDLSIDARLAAIS